jgi:hypothetical protein
VPSKPTGALQPVDYSGNAADFIRKIFQHLQNGWPVIGITEDKIKIADRLMTNPEQKLIFSSPVFPKSN